MTAPYYQDEQVTLYDGEVLTIARDVPERPEVAG
ncbi:hypothetical protein DSM43518_04807 [Mycobacterium marinum]|nr:hypothetical protein CCUG20998_03869 [Mycobacterium marinum]RFZ02820.1 hypothetical protein DSM43518_04807 [Mycobacterium marinum]RFZ26011.1 hypothetical protein DSM43519_01325 [Mycobacterium marinum]RFZ28890.1 hypothetical protein DSM44344_01157 [Mycobacterium marinum]RFZ39076.1 hypothetical protein NCTC2275_00344 [Mycobacterium marinum]